jgi:hypothetical protein
MPGLVFFDVMSKHQGNSSADQVSKSPKAFPLAVA